MNVSIYIPTRGRVGMKKQITLQEFLGKSNYTPRLVSPPNEVREHRRYHRKTLACPVMGIGPTRQWILENSDADVVIMVDDDMKFQYRPDFNSTKLEQAMQLDSMIVRCLEAVRKGFIHGGVSARQGNNHIKEHHRDCQRNCNFHFLHRKSVLEAGARLDILPVMEDFHFILTLLTQGYPNRVIYTYCWNQRPGSVGGCNLYRTLEMQKQAAIGLHKAFPEFVTIVKKTSKTGWSIAKGERYDVRVQWQKAYKSSEK